MGKITIHIDIAPQVLADILVTAFDGSYGGSWYWARPSPDDDTNSWLKIDDQGEWLACRVEEMEPSTGDNIKIFTVTHELLEQGIQKLFGPGTLPGRNDIRNELLKGGDCALDADQADVVVQLACFGELVYG